MDRDQDDMWLLVEAARRERDEDPRADLVWGIAQHGRNERMAVIKQLISRNDMEDRALAADIVAATPYFPDPEGRAWAREHGLPAAEVEPFETDDREWLTAALSRNLARSDDPDLVYASVGAIGKQGLVDAAEAVLAHARNADDDVRMASAIALGELSFDQPITEPVVRTLLLLAQDPVDVVRDWALFSLGRGSEPPLDLPEVRAVLAENVTHPDEDVREEAIRGLALLGDVTMIEQALENYELDLDLVEVARRAGDPRLRQPLLQLLERESRSEPSGPETSEYVREALLSAIDAC